MAPDDIVNHQQNLFQVLLPKMMKGSGGSAGKISRDRGQSSSVCPGVGGEDEGKGLWLFLHSTPEELIYVEILRPSLMGYAINFSASAEANCLSQMDAFLETLGLRPLD